MRESDLVSLESLAAQEKSAISKPFGSAILRSDYRADGIPVVRGVNLGRGIFFDREFVFIDEKVAGRMPGAWLRAGDLIVTHRGTVGQVSMIPRVPRYESYVASTSQVKVRLNESIAHPEFLYYWFQSLDGKSSILENLSTVGVPGLVQPVATVKRLLVPNPLLAVQRAIAEVLGALDDKIAANTNVAETSETVASRLFSRACADVGTRPMSEGLSPILGGTPPRANSQAWQGSNLWTTVRDVTSAPLGIVVTTEETISDLAASTSRTRLLAPGSVVLTARGTVGRVARLAEPSAINQSCYGFEARTIPPGVLYFSIHYLTEQAKSHSHGSVFSTITMRTFDHLRVPTFSPLRANELEDSIAPLLGVATACVRENLDLATLRDTLLPELMSGRLRVKDAERQVEDVV